MFFAGYITGLLALALAALPGATAYPDPGACSGDCWAHDPCMIKRSDGTYFRFNTGSKIGIWTADAISMFMLTPGTSSSASRGIDWLEIMILFRYCSRDPSRSMLLARLHRFLFSCAGEKC